MKRARDEALGTMLESMKKLSKTEIVEKFSPKERCVFFLHSGLAGSYDLCETLAATVDLSSDDMTDAVVDVLIRDRIAQATKSGLVAGLVRNGAADDVVNRTRTGLLELAARCLNDIVAALGRRSQELSVFQIPSAREIIESYLAEPEDKEVLSILGDITRIDG